MDLSQATDARSPVPAPGEQRLPNLRALTSIRFFAALHVALYHMVRPFTLWGPLEPAMGAGYVGVSFFFVLSGFILTYSHAREYESGRGLAARFWMARLARIYPVYLVSMLVSAWLSRAQFGQPIHALAYVADLLMVQTWSIRMVNFFNVPAWSLASEAFFYLVFPFLFLRLRPSSARKAMLSLTVLWILALALPVLCSVLYPGAAMYADAPGAPGGHTAFRISRIPILALPEFLSGVVLGWMYLRFRPNLKAASLLGPLGLALLAVTLMLADRIPYLWLHNGLLIPGFSMVILGLAEKNWLSRALSGSVLVLLGEASFSLYLIHFMFNGWTEVEFHAPQTVGAALWKLAAVIPLSILLHLGVERPCRRLILEWWRRRHPEQYRDRA